MELQFFCKVLVFVFVLSSSIDHASANVVPMSRILDHGIFELTNASCTAEGPLTDDEDATRFYTCILITEGADTYYFIVHWQCATGGQYDPTSGACIEIVILSSTETTTDTELTTTEPPTTELATTDNLPTTSTEPATTEPPTTATESSTTEPATTDISPTTELATTEPPTTAATEPPTTATELSTTEPPTTATEPPTTATEPETTESPTEPTTTVGTTALTTTTPPSPRCTEDGIFPNLSDPTKYYRCITILGKFYFYVFTCPANACYSPTSNLCVFDSCPAVTTTVSPTTVAQTEEPAPPVVCNGPGTFPYPSDCVKYYHCIQVGTIWYTYILSCPPGGYFDTTSLTCLLGECPASPTTLPSVPTTLPSSESTTLLPTTLSATTLAPVTTTKPFTCVKDGNYQHPDCTKYYKCLTISGSMTTYVMTCPNGHFYDSAASLCVTGTCPATSTATPSPASTTTQLVTTTPTTTTLSPITTTLPTLPTCETAGVKPFPTDCTKYYRCLKNAGMWYVYIFTCPAQTYFSPDVPGCIIGTCPVTTTVPTTEIPTDASSTATSSVTDATDTTDPSASTITTEITGGTGSTVVTTEITDATGSTDITTEVTDESTLVTTEVTDATDSTATDISTTIDTTVTELPTTGESLTTEEPATTESLPTTETEITTTDATTETELPTTLDTTSTVTEDATVVVEADPTTEFPELPTTSATFVCTSEGSFPDTENCRRYFNCISIAGKLYKYLNTCPANTHYDATKKLCTAGTC